MEEEGFLGIIRDVKGQTFSAFNYDLIKAIFHANAMPVPLPIVLDKEFIKTQLNGIDGIIFAGGEDIHPSNYGEEPHENSHSIDVLRDQYEMLLIEEALKKNIPALFICRGM